MPKQLTGLYLQTDTNEELKALATRVGCSISDLGDLFIRRGLERASDDALRQWASSLETKRGRLGGGLTKNERAALAALRTLHAEGEGAWIFPANAVAGAAGLRSMETFAALSSLARRGMVEQRRAEQAKVNRWGRPVQTFWMLPGTEKRVLPGEDGQIEHLREVRAEIKTWVDGGCLEADLFETLLPAVRLELQQVKAKMASDPAWTPVRALIERDVTRATGLRPREIADPADS